MRDGDSVLVFSDDWGRHPSSCQHLVRRLLPSHPVWWVNTIGMRPPKVDFATAHRGLEKARQWLRSVTIDSKVADNPRVLNPRMWPWFASFIDRAINRRLLLKQLLPAIRSMSGEPVVVTTVPIVADLIGALPAKSWVYYCVDDFSVWPGLAHDAILKLERKLLREADRIIAVSETLRQRLTGMGRECHLLTHGVDMDHWLGGQKEIHSSIAKLPGPIALFWGVVDRRMDTEFVRRLTDDPRIGTVVFAGPISDPDPALLRLPRIAMLGAVPYADLPALAYSADVLVMPYADLPVNQAIQPLKLKEYLATGKPVVARDLPANREWSDCLDLTATPEEFLAAVTSRLRTGLPTEQRMARVRLNAESWDEKARCFEQWLQSPQNQLLEVC